MGLPLPYPSLMISLILPDKADLTESQLHALMEVIKAIIAAAVTFFIIRHRRKMERKKQKQVDRIEKNTQPKNDDQLQ